MLGAKERPLKTYTNIRLLLLLLDKEDLLHTNDSLLEEYTSILHLSISQVYRSFSSVRQ